MGSINYFSEIEFSGCETFKYEQCHPASWSIFYVDELRFQGPKPSNMGSALQQLG